MAETEGGGAGVGAGMKRPAPDDEREDLVSTFLPVHDALNKKSSRKGPTTVPPIDPALIARCDAASREERLRKNREKARSRRNRKKALIEEMQQNVVLLSRMNDDLREKNLDLIRKLAQYGGAGHPGALEGLEVSLYNFASVLCVLRCTCLGMLYVMPLSKKNEEKALCFQGSFCSFIPFFRILSNDNSGKQHDTVWRIILAISIKSSRWKSCMYYH